MCPTLWCMVAPIRRVVGGGGFGSSTKESAVSPKAGRTGAGRRRHATFATMLVAALVVPVAIAYACNPQAHLTLDKTSYQPGSAITVHGSYFANGKPVTITGPSGTSTVTASSAGGFTTTMTAPSTPGSYSITASK